MSQYSVQPYQERGVSTLPHLVKDLIDVVAEQATQHPYQTGFSAGIAVGLAAKGFGAPGWLSFLIGLGAAAFTAEGLKRERARRYY